jgi:hypothetical protein
MVKVEGVWKEEQVIFEDLIHGENVQNSKK